MKKFILKYTNSLLKNICIGFIILYCLLSLLPMPKAEHGPLDSSWQYAISKAAEEQLIFGKDIIFTYGSLGYLIGGMQLDHNKYTITIFRGVVYFVFGLIAFMEIRALKSFRQKIVLGFILIHALLFGTSHVFIVDYLVLSIFLYLLYVEGLIEKSLHFWSIALGGFVGFCFHTKFTLGIGVFGSLIIFFSSMIFKSIKARTSLIDKVAALLNSLLSAISVTLILWYPAIILQNFIKIIVGLIVSWATTRIVFIIIKKPPLKKITEFLIPFKADIFIYNLKLNILNLSIFYSVFSLFLLKIIYTSNPSLLDYMVNSFEIISGYSAGMSKGGSDLILLLGIIEIFFIAILLLLVLIEGHTAFALVLLFNTALIFKHGFVRQDFGHISQFAMFTSIIVIFCIGKTRKQRTRIFAYGLCAYSILVGFVFTNEVNIYKTLKPRNVAKNIELVGYWSGLYSRNVKKKESWIDGLRLPDNIISNLRNKKVDIIPWDILLVKANQLNWKPRPIFQSYSAYSVALDDINFKSLLKEPRDYILYNFKSIDKRHPFFDEPKTFFYVYCNYQPSIKMPYLINTSRLSNIILLERRSEPRNKSEGNKIGSGLSIPWETPYCIESNDNQIIMAKVKIYYSIIGKILKVFFRVAPVKMHVGYADGGDRHFRIVHENSSNGIIISHLPRDSHEALSFFKGNLPAKVKWIEFKAKNSLIFKPKIELTIIKIKIL